MSLINRIKCNLTIKLMSRFDFNTPNEFTALGKRTINNYVFELFALIPDYQLECKPDCLLADDCEGGFMSCKYGPKVIRDRKSSAILVGVEVSVKGSSEDNWIVDKNDVKLIDDKGYCYDGRLLCDSMQFPETFPKSSDVVFPGTRRRVFHYFEPLPAGRTISCVLITDGRKNTARFELGKTSLDTADLASHEAVVEREPVKKAAPSPVLRMSDFSWRLDNLEKKVQELTGRIDSLLASHPQIRYEAPAYQKGVAANNEIKTVSQLLALDADGFAIAVKSLLEKQGFQEMSEISSGMYEGTFFRARKYGTSYVIYCFPASGSVEVSSVKLLVNKKLAEGAEKGLFVTTGKFSRDAEIMAYSNAIEMVDKGRIAIQLSLTDDTFGYQPSIG